jgi:hypothetical protein
MSEFKFTTDEARFVAPVDNLHPEAGKPLACSSPLREVINGVETRVHDGYWSAIRASDYQECSPIPASIHFARGAR